MTVLVTSGRSWSIAPSMDATRAAVIRRAAILFWSTRSSVWRRIVQTVDVPNPMIRTATIIRRIFAASFDLKMAGFTIQRSRVYGNGAGADQNFVVIPPRNIVASALAGRTV